MVFACVAIWLAKLACLDPVVLVQSVDFAEKQKKEGSYMGFRLMTDEKQKLHDMPLHEYISEVTKGRLIRGDSRDWEELFANVKAITEDKRVSREWSRRLPSDQHPMKILFFRADEQFLSALSGYFRKAGDVAYAAKPGGKQTEYLKLEYRVYTDDDFHFGSGLSSYPHPPTYLFYPYRKYSLWLVFAGLIAYLFLPRAKSAPGSLQYPLWRMVLGDIASFLLIVPFFSLPIFVIGGSMQLFTAGWPLIPFFWPLFFIGVWLLVISAWFASYRILLLEDRLRISTYKGPVELPFGDISFFQPVIFRPPKWLIALSWLAALSGKGSAQIGAAGRAMILGSSASGSIGIRLKNGADVFINVTDQMGGNALKGFQKILKKMKENGIEEKDEVREIRSLGLETMRLPE
ncbi:MAG TPA: hypothetical protein VN328_03750 [Thermodesulfovibrionales bacterium]|nr:hypothetical protein [Thermodesulfovibrionales bacterium]